MVDVVPRLGYYLQRKEPIPDLVRAKLWLTAHMLHETERELSLLETLKKIDCGYNVLVPANVTTDAQLEELCVRLSNCMLINDEDRAMLEEEEQAEADADGEQGLSLEEEAQHDEEMQQIQKQSAEAQEMQQKVQNRLEIKQEKGIDNDPQAVATMIKQEMQQQPVQAKRQQQAENKSMLHYKMLVD